MEVYTIKDVAKEAGVSIATVSRVINKADNVNPALRKKVLKVIEKLDYKPNRIAQGLKSNTTNTIGIIISDISNPFFMRIIKEIENIVHQEGYTLILGSTDDSPQKELEYIKLLYEKRIDALVISSTGENEDYLNELQAAGMPIVFIDRRPVKNKFDSVYVDKVTATYQMVKYLLDQNHRSIALTTGPRDIITNYDRYVGYTKACYEFKLEINNDYLKFGHFTVDFGKKSLKELLNLKKRPTAIISGSSLITKGILIQANKDNLEIPKDFSLVSFGNISMNELICPKMTYLEQMIHEIGKNSAEILLNKLLGSKKGKKEIKLEAKIAIGDSVLNLKN
ncbi:LacI family DNA-binding transcriptional regulator [Iocasia frigidifontis]|uniref:LacI family DNA-binding transcriptional regulator n=1 Tax=Iocasia fonsfrigidae TaxID=2682810 RepID=A0A8A7KID0_9FIRM|nr:LacI family DNA-binding transcriptional regulator [Iocasia fonsfrigidae]QTL99558.1 LacI family DNA-binding transcriptional regulator [Iocasia fonsfrigidae]